MEIVAGENACYLLPAFISLKMELNWRKSKIGKVRPNSPLYKKFTQLTLPGFITKNLSDILAVMSITVFLADDHRMVREGIGALLQSQPDINVIGEAGTGREAIRQVRELKPDVVLMDFAMPDLNGAEATQEIARLCPSTKVIVLSMHSTSQHIFRAIKAGARGYILKESAGEDAASAIRAVQKGQLFLCSQISERVVRDYVMNGDMADAQGPLAQLSDRERQVLELLVEGASNVRIAELLFISPKTVETHRSHLMQKLGINDLPGLVKFAIQHGITTLE